MKHLFFILGFFVFSLNAQENSSIIINTGDNNYSTYKIKFVLSLTVLGLILILLVSNQNLKFYSEYRFPTNP